MLTKARTCALAGLDGQIVEVEVDVAPGLPAFIVVGPAGRGGPRVEGAGACGDPELGLRVSDAPDHGESSAGGPAQGGSLVRPAHRGGDTEQQRADCGLSRGHGADRGAIARRAPPAYGRDTADGRSRAAARAEDGGGALDECGRGGLGGGSRGARRRLPAGAGRPHPWRCADGRASRLFGDGAFCASGLRGGHGRHTGSGAG